MFWLFGECFVGTVIGETEAKFLAIWCLIREKVVYQLESGAQCVFESELAPRRWLEVIIPFQARPSDHQPPATRVAHLQRFSLDRRPLSWV